VEKLPVLKVVIAGDENVGKTSLVRRYCEGQFDASRVATIGVDFQTQTVELPTGMVKLSIWDMAGQDRFKFLRGDFYRGALASALVFDVTNPQSLISLKQWYEEVNENQPGQKFIVVGNKIDLEEGFNSKNATAIAQALKAPYVQTSALSGEGVDKLFMNLAHLASIHQARTSTE
jgi:small GTP-binding protein